MVYVLERRAGPMGGWGEPARSRLLSGQRWHARSVSALIANCPVDVAQKLLATRKAGESFLAVFLVFCSSCPRRLRRPAIKQVRSSELNEKLLQSTPLAGKAKRVRTDL